MKERILVTGGDGFLGYHLVQALHTTKRIIRVFSEPGRDSESFGDIPVEVGRGDIRNLDDVMRAVDGCDAIVHAAASTSIWPSRSRHLEAVNVGGTRNIIEAALSAGVKRLVHVGTANSFGAGTRDNPGTEEKPFSGRQYRLGYIETKREAQRLVHEAVERRGLPSVIVAPTFMIGPHDAKPGSGKLIIAIAGRQLPGFSRGGRNYVYVKDVAAGIASALDHGRIGESYILGNENLSYGEFFEKVGKVAGVVPPRLSFPDFMVKAAGVFGSVTGTVARRVPRVTLPVARISVDAHYYSAEKAVRDLGMPQTPIDIAIREALDWFRANGYLSR